MVPDFWGALEYRFWIAQVQDCRSYRRISCTFWERFLPFGSTIRFLRPAPETAFVNHLDLAPKEQDCTDG
jgi:hypothetical protein